MTVAKTDKPATWYPRPDAAEIGNRLRVMMECRGMSPADLHRATGIPYPTLDGYLRGARVPILRNLLALAQVFRVASLDVLVCGCSRSRWHRLRPK